MKRSKAARRQPQPSKRPEWEKDPMLPAPKPVPDLDTLTMGLTSVFSRNRSTPSRITVVDREYNLYRSSFSSEIVTCRMGDGSERRLFCKYDATDRHSAYGDRSGLAYEALVYSRVMLPSRISAPKFYGTYKHPATGQVWLILEYLDDAWRLEESADLAATHRAARWIGQFHAITEQRLLRKPIPALHRFDAEYYLGWARRTSRFAGGLYQRLPWLTTLDERFKRSVDLLLAAPPTVIHGEYYSTNVLLRDGIIYPVDWESAAIAAGEIDLASLTENWPLKLAREYEREYQRARWPKGAPAHFEPTLAAARLYLLLRCLGEPSVWTTPQSRRWCAEQLRAAGKRWELVS